MHCPKCGHEIPFYDLKPNCKHCGVNIMYFTQEEGLIRDAKRTELESAVARMVIARIKANFIGGKLQIARMAAVLVSVAALLLPLGGTQYSLPFFHETFSAGIIGVVKAIQNGFLVNLPYLLFSKLLSHTAITSVFPAAMFCVLAVLDLVIFALLLLGFMNVTGSTKHQKRASMVGVILSVLTQIGVIVIWLTNKPDAFATGRPGYGAIAAAVVYLVLFFLNRALLKADIEPKFKENDVKRKALLKQVRAGEVDLDSLPLPIFESDEEREERLKALEDALKAEEEGKEL